MESNQKKLWYVYMIECQDSSLYTGITTDVKRRFEEHQNGTGGNYTRSHPPVKVVYIEEVKDRCEASIREAEIKKMNAEEKRQLID